MFKIENGRLSFYQWDINQRLIIEDASITEVHFCNRTSDCSLVTEVYEENGKRFANVPNILLQDDWTIRVYAYCANYTKIEEKFIVFTRSKPADYIYTETEIKNYKDLEERINQIEENGISDETIAGAVEKYLEENDISVDLTGYATEEYVNRAISDIDIPDVDLTGYATEKYVDNAIAEAQLGGSEVDLSDYATKQYVDDAISGIDIPSGSGSEKEWVLIADTVLTEAAHNATFTQLPNGEAFSFSELMVYGAAVCNAGTTMRGVHIFMNDKVIASVQNSAHKAGTDISGKLFFYKGIIENGIANGVQFSPASSAQQINGITASGVANLVDFEKINSVGVEINTSADDFGAGTWFKIFGR